MARLPRPGVGGWIGLATAGLIVLTLASFWAVAQEQLRREAESNRRDSLLGEVVLLAHTLRPGEIASPRLQERMRDLGKRIGLRITVVAAGGRVLADSSVGDPASLESHAQSPEVQEARRLGKAVLLRTSGGFDKQVLYAAAKVPESDTVVRLAQDLSALEEGLAQPSRLFWVVGLLVGVFGIFFGIVFAGIMSRPIKELTRTAQAFADGDLRARVRPRGEGEIARLGKAFNRMAAQLEGSLGRAEAEAVRLNAVLEGMTEGVVALDADERISFLNGKAREILEVSPSSTVRHRPLYELVRDPKLLGLVAAAAQGNEPLEAEFVREGPPRRNVQVHAAPVRGESPGVILVLSDVSRLRQLERVRSDFVSNVSHELRTPLAAIAAASENLEDTEAREDPDAGPRFVEAIRRNTARLETLLDDILAISRYESRPDTLEKVPLDFAAIARTSCEDLRERARRGGVDLVVHAPERLRVRGDAQALRRIVDNLVLNAITYTPRGGSVTVELAAQPGSGVLSVKDTGIGIPRAELDRVFERFYRVDKARSRSAGGTGLGLAIVKHAVMLHGGQIAVESELGKGSCFRVSIPRDETPAASEPGEGGAESPAAPDSRKEESP